MDEILFSPLGAIGALLDEYSKTPYIVAEIEIDGKHYIGNVMSAKIKSGGAEIISGEFHPYIERNFFEAFEIFPNKFNYIRYIDIKAPAESDNLNLIFLE